MNLQLSDLPDNVEGLKNFVFAYHEAAEEEKRNIHKEYTTELELLREQLKLMREQLYGRKSERYAPEAFGQIRLFNENENETVVQEGALASIIKVPAHNRRKGGKRPLPKDLPREEIVYELSGTDLIHGCGREMKLIRYEETERLRHLPERFVVEVHKRGVYACGCEGVDTEGVEGAIRIASMKEQMIPQGIATASLLAEIITNKFCDALPFYRQEKIYERHGIEITRQSMCQWAQMSYERCRPMLDLMKKDLLSGPLINMDETPVQVLNEPDRANTTRSYMWVSSGGQPEAPVLLYEYHPTRSAEYIRKFLSGFKGKLQSDGYEAYKLISKEYGLQHASCWAHARRRFEEVIKASKNASSAHQAMSYIHKLYQVEREAEQAAMAPEARREQRQARSWPLLQEFKVWLDKKVTQVPPGSLMGKAVNYVLGEWEDLNLFLEDGRIPIDNNVAENAVRPFVLGRKNWLFSGSPDGAQASAGLYSLIETAKANGLEPYWYLYYLFDHLPAAKSKEEYAALLPYRVDKTKIMPYNLPGRIRLENSA